MSLMDTIKGWFGKGKDSAGDLTSQAKDLANTDAAKKVEDQVEKQADKGGTVGPRRQGRRSDRQGAGHPGLKQARHPGGEALLHQPQTGRGDARCCPFQVHDELRAVRREHVDARELASHRPAR